LVSVGECIVELFGDIESGYRLSFAGAALDMSKLLRAQLGADWSVDLLTALGDDIYSQNLVDDLSERGIGTSHLLKVPGRTIGLSLVGDPGDNGPLITNWRGQSAGRFMADDVAALADGFDGADVIFVSGVAFAILLPRARGRLLKALHRARQAGARIVLYPLEWPDLWTSDRVLGSAINSIATIADTVFTASAGERSVFGDPDAEAVATRYRAWGVEDVLVRNHDRGVFLSSPAGGRWVDVDTSPGGDHLNSAYLAARAGGASPEDAAAQLPSREKSV
jgi:2-dehydro-3-deoxygluconokinase